MQMEPQDDSKSIDFLLPPIENKTVKAFRPAIRRNSITKTTSQTSAVTTSEYQNNHNLNGTTISIDDARRTPLLPSVPKINNNNQGTLLSPIRSDCEQITENKILKLPKIQVEPHKQRYCMEITPHQLLREAEEEFRRKELLKIGKYVKSFFVA